MSTLNIIKSISISLILISTLLFFGTYYQLTFLYIFAGIGVVYEALYLRYKLRTEKQILNWFKQHENQIILFYPTAKEIQTEIKTRVAPELDRHILHLYYNGPKITGNIEPELIEHFKYTDPNFIPNKISIIKIQDNKLNWFDVYNLSEHTLWPQQIETDRIKMAITRAEVASA